MAVSNSSLITVFNWQFKVMVHVLYFVCPLAATRRASTPQTISSVRVLRDISFPKFTTVSLKSMKLVAWCTEVLIRRGSRLHLYMENTRAITDTKHRGFPEIRLQYGLCVLKHYRAGKQKAPGVNGSITLSKILMNCCQSRFPFKTTSLPNGMGPHSKATITFASIYCLWYSSSTHFHEGTAGNEPGHRRQHEYSVVAVNKGSLWPIGDVFDDVPVLAVISLGFTEHDIYPESNVNSLAFRITEYLLCSVILFLMLSLFDHHLPNWMNNRIFRFRYTGICSSLHDIAVHVLDTELPRNSCLFTLNRISGSQITYHEDSVYEV